MSDPLLEAALKAREHAHARVFGFQGRRGARGFGRRIHTGCNIENATYGLTMCAERVAVFKAMSEGARTVPADGGRGGYRCTDAALRVVPADPLGVLRRHRSGAW